MTDTVIDTAMGTVVENPHYMNSQKSDTGHNDDDDDDTVAPEGSNCSIAIHSRHSSVTNNGTDISQEIACVQNLWQQYVTTTHQSHINNHDAFTPPATTSKTTERARIPSECDVYVMTDRPHTLKYLVEWCHSYQPPPPSSLLLSSYFLESEANGDLNNSYYSLYNSNSNSNITIPSFPCRRVIYAKHDTVSQSFVAEHGYVGLWYCFIHSFLHVLACSRQEQCSTVYSVYLFTVFSTYIILYLFIHTLHDYRPYAGGAGFLQDLALVRSSANSIYHLGIVGGKRSSTDLLVEWIEYDRMVNYYERTTNNDNNSINQQPNNEERPIPELPRCYIPSRR